MSLRQFSVLVASMCLLAGCGGGGGGGGGNPNPPSSPGSFTLSGTTASFSGISGLSAPAEKTFTLTVTGTKVAAVGAGYANGQTPASWLSVDITGSGNNYTLHVGIQPGGGAALGTNTASFTVGTGDVNGNILKTQVFTVTYVLDPHLEASASSAVHNFQFGDAVRIAALPVTVTAPGRQWKLTSSSSWLVVPSANQTGNGTVDATIDVTGVPPASYAGTIRVENAANPNDFRELTVEVFIAPASFTVTENSVDFGGETGTEPLDGVPVHFALNTGTGVHPFTASVTTDSGGDWLTLDQASGTVGSAGGTVTLNVNPAQITGGTYTGELTLSTSVYGTVFTEVRPVTLNIEASKLVVSAYGVGLSRVAGRSVLTRTLKVFNGNHATDTPWTATSDSPWLSVTASGVTGGDLVLTASPTGLADDTTHVANVTISSSDPRVENQQSVRVGLYLSDTAPATLPMPNVLASSGAANPVEPLFALLIQGDVHIYNAYTGAELRVLPDLATLVNDPSRAERAPRMSFSEDGLSLFVQDLGNERITQVDHESGSVIRHYSAPIVINEYPGDALGLLHPNGSPILVTNDFKFYDLENGAEIFPVQQYDIVYGFQSYSASPDQSLFLVQSGNGFRIARSALHGGETTLESQAVASQAQSADRDSCFDPTGQLVYTAAVSPYGFAVTPVDTYVPVGRLAGDYFPNTVKCVWNGLVVGGISSDSIAHDILVYYGPTEASLGALSSNADTFYSGRRLQDRGLSVLGDGTRVLAVYEGGGGYNPGASMQTLPPPP